MTPAAGYYTLAAIGVGLILSGALINSLAVAGTGAFLLLTTALLKLSRWF